LFCQNYIPLSIAIALLELKVGPKSIRLTLSLIAHVRVRVSIPMQATIPWKACFHYWM
jgi:hypothetical protein